MRRPSTTIVAHTTPQASATAGRRSISRIVASRPVASLPTSAISTMLASMTVPPNTAIDADDVERTARAAAAAIPTLAVA
jgi:hypothetical protein